MKQDYGNLSCSELERILNGSAEPGHSPATTKRLRLQRQRAGTIIAGTKKGKIDLFKYIKWLRLERKKQQAAPVAAPRSYEEIKEAARERSAEKSVSGRDIAPLPQTKDPARRARCSLSLKDFCETYFPETFYLDWSPDHLKVIAKIETAARDGGLFALAMPRGEGKTTMCERAVLWAALYGYRKFIVIIGATETAAIELMDTVKAELESNDLLFEDFPEVCYPIRRLEGINNRASGQLLNGERTQISWCGTEIVLPTVKDAPSSGVIILSVGITGRVRGMKRKVNGKDVRPELVVIDDPQTRESAESAEQCAKRLRTIKGDILGLAGPGKKISGVMPCTVISPDDVADQILNRDKNPEWNGERLALLRSFPDKEAMKLWDQYREISVDSYRKYNDNHEATEFYRLHRVEMDRGAEPSWEDRYNYDEISAIQYAMNLYYKGAESFLAEYQNDPRPQQNEETAKITVEQVFARLNHRARGVVPIQASTLTMFIDIQKDLLYYTVCAFSERFDCWVIDYGTYPDQKRRYFTLKDVHTTIGDVYKAETLEGTLYQAIKELTELFFARDFVREDKGTMRISRCAVDSGWGLSTNAVYLACKQSIHASQLLPSKGVGITAAQKPFTEYKKVLGEKLGDNWRLSGARGKYYSKLLEYDTNFWKSFFRARLLTSPGDPGSFTLWGSDEELHRMFAEHLSSETATPTAGRGRQVDIWKMIPNRENHFLDGVVGCMVLASLDGCKILEKKMPLANSLSTPKRERRVHTLGKVNKLH